MRATDMPLGDMPLGDMPLGPLMVDLAGHELSAEEREFLRHPAIGAIILFARNYADKSQLRELTREIKSIRANILIAVDQEGGRVQRFQHQFHRLPAAADIGDLFESKPDHARTLAENCGKTMAAEVLSVGVDFSFAPVLDIRPEIENDNDNGNAAHVIGDRAFHANPEIVADLAHHYIKGMTAAGMVATGKHFPGHGGVADDSHHTLPKDPRSLAELESRDLLPFANLASQLGGIMTAHIAYPNIDVANIAAQLPTYSKFWLGEYLREKLQFRGVIFSDDLSMQGAAGDSTSGDLGDLTARCIAALDAGCDMLPVCNDPAAVRNTADKLAERIPDQKRLAGMRPKRLS